MQQAARGGDEGEARVPQRGLGAQHVVSGAPIVILHATGAIAAVLGDVAGVDAR